MGVRTLAQSLLLAWRAPGAERLGGAVDGLMKLDTPQTYQGIFKNIDRSEVVVVTGEEDNVFTPQGVTKPWELIDKGVVTKDQTIDYDLGELPGGKYEIAIHEDQAAPGGRRVAFCRGRRRGSSLRCRPGMSIVPRIEVVSQDGVLVDRIRGLAAEGGRSAMRIDTDEPWSEPLESSVRVVDLTHVAWPCRGNEAPALTGSQRYADLVLVIPRSERSPAVRYHQYPRAALDALLDEALHELPLEVDAPGVLLLGDSPAIRAVREQIASVASYGDVSVLVSGETGTGKELAAQTIHLGSRRPGPFVAMNCAAVPETLFEDELFGHDPGAARAPRVGLLETAAQGTLFLDEVDAMPPRVQARLLRVLETRTFQRLGSGRDIPLHARIISATHRPLHAAGADGQLRRDLLYRLAGFTVSLPTLRSRAGDIELLAEGFLAAFARRHRRPPPRLSRAAVELLREPAWPGNVRELRAVVEQAAILASGPQVDRAEIVLALRSGLGRCEDGAEAAAGSTFSPKASGVVRVPLRDVERELIVRAYEEAHGNLTRAAADLGIPRTTLRDKLRRFGVSKAEEG